MIHPLRFKEQNIMKPYAPDHIRMEVAECGKKARRFWKKQGRKTVRRAIKQIVNYWAHLK